MKAVTLGKPRDERLDFFRGLTMFIIFIAHADINPLNNWIPARFGFSSGAEVFVFCSGFASALAFGSVFVKQGFGLGIARVAYRLWQVYWAHICSALAIITVMSIGRQLFPAFALHLEPLTEIIADPIKAIVSLVTLSWLPGYLDILPMYLVLLALIPLMMICRQLHPWFPIALSLFMYTLVWTTGINLPGNPWTGEVWYFNPFAWQLIFFTGFAFGIGWLRVPPLRNQTLMIACIAALAVSIPITFWGVHDNLPSLQAFYRELLPSNEKTDLHPLRFLHFLTLAYVMLSLIEPYRDRLSAGAAMIVTRVGQQSLAVFLVSLVTARVGSIIFQRFGTDISMTLLVNLVGVAVIIGTAYGAQWFKSAPWQKQRIDRTAHGIPVTIGAIDAKGAMDQASLGSPSPSLT